MTIMIQDLIVHRNDTVEEVLAQLDVGGQGIVFVVDEDGRLGGIATDGDIRRSLLGGAGLADPVEGAMNRDYVAAPVSADSRTVAALFNDRIRVVPLLDADGRPADYATLQRPVRIPVASPNLEGNELAYVMDCIHSGWISSRGTYIGRFETMVAQAVGAERALAVSNGTAALHLALLAFGIGPGDEVIVPDLTFAATINAVLHAGATPVVVDVDRDTWNIAVSAVTAAVTPRTRAVIPVHLYGLPADMAGLMALANRHGLVVIEDAAEALGSRYQGRPVGSLGHAACFSFFANKLITTGEGGMLALDDHQAADRAARLRDHGMSPDRRYWHEEVGYNYRLTNLQAAIGVAQMERMDGFLARKRELAQRYRERLSAAPGVILPAETPDAMNSYWAFSIILEDLPHDRNRIVTGLQSRGIETRPLFYPLHRMPPYQVGTDAQFPNAVWLSDRGLTLPSSVNTRPEEIDFICAQLERLLAEG